jgi:hypothetical protein
MSRRPIIAPADSTILATAWAWHRRDLAAAEPALESAE